MNGVRSTERPIERHLERCLHGGLLALAAFGVVGLTLLSLHLSVPLWLLPACALAGVFIVRPREVDAVLAPSPRWLPYAAGALFAVAVAAVAYGSFATLSRHWDGAAVWDLKVLYLRPSLSLEHPYFRDGAVYTHSRDYPLLQPLTMAVLDRLAGEPAGRALFPLAYAALVGLLWTALRRLGERRLAIVCALACALTPMLLTPTSGGADSGYADLLLAVCCTAMAAGLVTGDSRLLGVGAALAVMTKPEGLCWAAMPVALTFLRGERGLLRGSLSGFLLGAAAWLPLRQQLQNPGSPAIHLATYGLLLAFGAAVLGVDAWLARVRASARARWCCGLVLAPAVLLALPLLVLLLGDPGGTVRVYFGEPLRAWQRLPRLPAIVAGLFDHALLKLGFACTFWLLPLAWWWRRRAMAPATMRLCAFVAVGLAGTLAPFLLSPETDLEHHLKSSMSRLLLHWLGPAWLAIGALLQPRADAA
jgi:hypothetical protein